MSGASEWRRGWPAVAITAFGLTCAPATLPVYTIGLFVAPLRQAFGWSHAAIQAAILFSTGLGVIGGPLAGRLVRQFGLRTTILSGLAGMTVALLICAAMTGWLWQLYLAYALMSLAGAGANAVAWSTLVAGRFRNSRGLALGIALSGTGLSAMLMPRIAAAAMAAGGWRSAYLALAGFVILIVAPVCALALPSTRDATRTANPAHHSGVDVSVVVRTVRFWLIGLSSMSIYMAVGGLIPNLVPALAEKGVSARDALGIVGTLGFAIIVGRIAVGLLVDRIWAPLVAAMVLVPAAAGCLALSGSHPLAVYGVSAAAIGMVTGMEFDMLAFLIGRYFGLRDYARIYGRLYMFLAVGAGAAPMAFGAIFDRVHSYAIPVQLAASLLIAGAVGMLALGPYPAAADGEDTESIDLPPAPLPG